MVRTADSKEAAAKIVHLFKAKPHRRQIRLNASWPKKMQEVGCGRAVMYRSNKWKHDPREWEDYKHIAESEQRVAVTPGFLCEWDHAHKKLEVHGPMIELVEPMPLHVAALAPLLGVQLQLYDKRMKLGEIYEVRIKHATLAAARHPVTDEPFLLVYTKDPTVHMILSGSELNVEKDGIVG